MAIIIVIIVAIGFLCWLLYTLAIYALPFFIAVSIATWAFHTGAGWLGAALIGLAAAGLTLGVGQVLFAAVRPLWARLLIALAFVAPAAIAGYYATHGLVQYLMPSQTWQFVFSGVGAIVVGITAFQRVLTMAPSNQGLKRT